MVERHRMIYPFPPKLLKQSGNWRNGNTELLYDNKMKDLLMVMEIYVAKDLFLGMMSQIKDKSSFIFNTFKKDVIHEQ